MKKRLLSLALCLCMSAVAVTGCKKEEEKKSSETSKKETIEVENIPVEDDNVEALHKVLMKRHGDAALENTTVGDYSKLALEVEEQVEVTDDFFNSEIDSILEEYAYTFEGTVVSGQTVNIDYEGSVDGELFDGGSATAYDLQIGSGTLIAGFEEQLIDMAVGETKTINVTFPEDYTSETLAGKDAQFKVTVNAIKLDEGKSELTDQWVELFLNLNSGIVTDGTVDSFKDYMRESMETYYVQLREENEMDAAINALVEIVTLKDSVPEKHYNYYENRVEENLTTLAENYSMTLEEYIEAIGLSDDEYKEELENTADMSMKYEFAIITIGEANNLAPTEEEYTAYLTEVAEAQGMTMEDYRTSYQSEYQLQIYLATYEEKVLNMLLETAVITDVTSSAVTAE